MRTSMIRSTDLISNVHVEKSVLSRDVVVTFNGAFVVSWIDAGDTIKKHTYTDIESANNLANKLKSRDK